MNNNQENFNIREIMGEEPEIVSFNQKQPEKKKKFKFKFKRKYFHIGLGIFVVAVLILVGFAFYKGWFSFSKDRVNLDIAAPTEVASGEEVEFSIGYQNNNRIALKDTKLIIEYPRGAYSSAGDELTQEIISIGNISPKDKGSKSFKMRLAGEQGSVKSLVVKLEYQPANINSRFENSLTFNINISSVLIGVYLTPPQKAMSGGELTYILDYINNSDQDFSDLIIELNYPSGFTFKTADPPPTKEDNIWQLQELKKNERGTINISGILEGMERENKTIEVVIGKAENDKFLRYSQASAVTQISSSPLIINLLLNDQEEESNVNAKQLLKYEIRFRNNTDISLSQLILRAYLQGEMFNFKLLKLVDKGFFDSLNNVITWSAVGVPSLALLPPGESGLVKFSIPIDENFPINNFDDKNLQISVRIELETLNVPPPFSLKKLKVEKILKSKVNSKVVLKTKGYYNETSAGINNFGPIPPRVNQTTTYTIHWQITNTSDDLENVRITSILPEGIEWRNVYTALNKDSRLEYNERTKQIVWKIDKIPAATGFLIPVYEIVFQVALIPSVTQISTSPVLIDESKLEGKDTFTGEILESFTSALDTDLPDDLSIGQRGGRVME